MISATLRLAYWTTQVSLPCLTAQGSFRSMDFNNAIGSSSRLARRKALAPYHDNRPSGSPVPHRSARRISQTGARAHASTATGSGRFSPSSSAPCAARAWRTSSAATPPAAAKCAAAMPAACPVANAVPMTRSEAPAIRSPSAVRPAANRLQTSRLIKRAQRNVVSLSSGLFEAAVERRRIVKFARPGAERDGVGKPRAGAQILGRDLVDRIDVPRLASAEFGTGRDEIGVLVAGNAADRVEVGPGLAAPAHLRGTDAGRVPCVVFLADEIRDDVA